MNRTQGIEWAQQIEVRCIPEWPAFPREPADTADRFRCDRRSEDLDLPRSPAAGLTVHWPRHRPFKNRQSSVQRGSETQALLLEGVNESEMCQMCCSFLAVPPPVASEICRLATGRVLPLRISLDPDSSNPNE